MKLYHLDKIRNSICYYYYLLNRIGYIISYPSVGDGTIKEHFTVKYLRRSLSFSPKDLKVTYGYTEYRFHEPALSRYRIDILSRVYICVCFAFVRFSKNQSMQDHKQS